MENKMVHQDCCRPPFDVKKNAKVDSGFPNYCTATRKIEPGQIVLEESPIFYFPSPSTLNDGSSAAEKKNKPSCVSCGLKFKLQDPDKELLPENCCSVCSWPVCSKECEKMEIHSTNECRIFSTLKIRPCYSVTKNKKDVNQVSYRPVSIVKIFRTLAVYQYGYNQPMRDAILCLQLSKMEPNNRDSTNANCENSDQENIKEISDDEVKSLIKETCQEADAFLLLTSKLVEDFATIDRIFASQGFVFQEYGCSFPRYLTATYMYKEASNFNHSCSPNCSWIVGPSPDFKIQIRASTPIYKGDMITLNRIQHHKYAHFGTLLRQPILMDKFGFQCKCNLCTDPTELQSFMSALVCSHCQESKEQRGYLLPVNPLNISEDEQIWRCSSCNTVASVSQDVKVLREQLTRMDVPWDSDPAKRAKAQELSKSVILTLSEQFLHTNHWIVQEAYKYLIQCTMLTLRHPENDKREAYACFWMNLFLLGIMDNVAPGLTYQQAILKWQAVHSFQVFLEEEIKVLGTLSHKILRELMDLQEECVEMTVELIEYYKGKLPPRGSNEQTIIHDLTLKKEINAYNTTILKEAKLKSASLRLE